MESEVMFDDLNGRRTYVSPLLNKHGVEWYSQLLIDAVRHFDYKWLAAQLIEQKMIVKHEVVQPGNRLVPVQMSDVENFTRQEFDLLRARAICSLSLSGNRGSVEVCTTDEIKSTSLALRALLYCPLNAHEMLDKLRGSASVEEAVGLVRDPSVTLRLRKHNMPKS